MPGIHTMLVDSAADSLDAAQRQRLDRHVAGCAACSRDLAALREIPALLQASTVPDPGEEFWTRQRQAVARAVRNVPVSRSTWQLDWLREVLRVQSLRYSVAVAASLLVAVFIYRFAGQEPGEASAPAPRVAALDADAVLALHEVVQALAPGDEDPLQSSSQDEASIAALPVDELIGVVEHASAEVPHATDLTEPELDEIDDLIGSIG